MEGGADKGAEALIGVGGGMGLGGSERINCSVLAVALSVSPDPRLVFQLPGLELVDCTLLLLWP